MNTQNLIRPSVVRVIRNVLVRHGFQPGELAGAIAEVTVRAIEAYGTGIEVTDRDQSEHQLAVLLDMLDHDEMPDMAELILEGIGERRSVADVARDLELRGRVVRERLREMRVRYFERLAVVGRIATSVLEDALDAAAEGAEELEKEEGARGRAELSGRTVVPASRRAGNAR
jgi:hypothetical protein